jgi:acetyl esterase/lipase
MRVSWDQMVAARTGGVLYTSPAARDLRLDGPGRPVGVRIVPAERPAAIFLHMHAGGWTVGSPAHEDRRLEWIAAAGLTCVSVDYSLAPEHPYPAGLDDCEQAALWVLRHGERELGSSRLVLGGESAGANLALATMLRLRRAGRPAPLGASLLYGNYDLRGTPSQARGSTMLSHAALEWFYDQYAPPAARSNPEVSPLRADLAGLPPTLLTVGGDDPLVDDSRLLHERMLEAGVDARLQLLEGADHGFDSAPLAVAAMARAGVEDFLRETTGRSASEGGSR